MRYVFTHTFDSIWLYFSKDPFDSYFSFFGAATFLASFLPSFATFFHSFGGFFATFLFFPLLHMLSRRLLDRLRVAGQGGKGHELGGSGFHGHGGMGTGNGMGKMDNIVVFMSES